MIDTLLKIGKQVSKGKDQWDDILDFVTYPTINKKEQELKNYVVNLVFDLDEKRVYFSDKLEMFDNEKTVKKIKHLKTKGGNPKSVYFTSDIKNINRLYKTLFGKHQIDNINKPEFLEAVEKIDIKLLETDICKIVDKCWHELKTEFESMLSFSSDDKKAVFKELQNVFKLSKFESIKLCYASVKYSEFGIEQVTPFNKLDGYDEFIVVQNFTIKESKGEVKLSYISGEFQNVVNVPEFSRNSTNINRLFVKTIINYANNFDDKSYNKNYQISEHETNELTRGAIFILDNYKILIAGIPHIIIPQFRNNTDLNYIKALNSIKSDSDLIFNWKKLENVTGKIKRKVEGVKQNKNVYWINYIAYKGNKNSFKVINQIKDVSQPYLQKVLDTFTKMGLIFSPWIGTHYSFNLSSLYYLILVRKSSEVNQALLLFSDILEHRKIEKDRIFIFFTELILCHYYKRYDGYKQINESNTNFDYLIKDSVFGYMALIKILEELNLLKTSVFMEKENVSPQKADDKSDYVKNIEAFFDKMGYEEEHKALFYLGRVLNKVAYVQSKKHPKKPVMNKLNYNGMDKTRIMLLRNDLQDKARQYSIISDTDFNFKRFTEYFDAINWTMPEQEALFFILSGYSFGITKKAEVDNNNEVTNE